MHRKQKTDMIPADTELERTLRSLRKKKGRKTQPWQKKGKIRLKDKEQQPEGLQLMPIILN